MEIKLYLIFSISFSDGNSNDDESNGETTKGLGVYAQNIDLHLHAADGASGETPGNFFISFFESLIIFRFIFIFLSKSGKF